MPYHADMSMFDSYMFTFYITVVCLIQIALYSQTLLKM
jgi:hypothetical protein